MSDPYAIDPQDEPDDEPGEPRARAFACPGCGASIRAGGTSCAQCDWRPDDPDPTGDLAQAEAERRAQDVLESAADALYDAEQDERHLEREREPDYNAVSDRERYERAAEERRRLR